MSEEETDFLKRLPLFLTVRQRIIFEGIGLASDVMIQSRAELLTHARSGIDLSLDNPKYPGDIRAKMFALAWTIVDQADLLRQLVRSEGRNIDLPSAKAFLAGAEVARRLRNWMDHLPSRLDAYIAKKGAMPPSHGAISFAAISPETLALGGGEPVRSEDVAEFRTVVITSTSSNRETKLEGEPYPYASYSDTIDHFVLQAFDDLFRLDEIVALAGAMRAEFTRGVEQFCLAEAKRRSSQDGQSISAHLKSSELPATTMVMVARRG